MSDKDLQGLTDCVSDIGQHSRRRLPPRRNHFTQKVPIANQRTLYISVHDHPSPSELFLWVKGADCTPELIGLYDVIAHLMSLSPRYARPSKSSVISSRVPNLLHTGQCGSIIHCSSLPDLIGRHLLVEYCRRCELAPIPGESAQPP